MSKKLAGFGAAGIILLLLTLVVSLGIGSVHLPVREIGAMLLHRLPGIGDSIVPGWEASSEQILMKVRLPRILLGMLVGASWPSPEPPFKGYCAIRWRIRLRSVYPRVLRLAQHP